MSTVSLPHTKRQTGTAHTPTVNNINHLRSSIPTSAGPPSPPLSTPSPTKRLGPHEHAHEHDPWFDSESHISSPSTSDTSSSIHRAGHSHHGDTASKGIAQKQPAQSGSHLAHLARAHHNDLPHLLQKHNDMSGLSSSLTGLEGSWRMEGSGSVEPPQLHNRSSRYTQEPIWDVNSHQSHPAVDHPLIPSGSTSVPIRAVRPRSPSPRKYADGPLPLPTAVWADVMDTSKGRDKVLKCLQYSLKTYVYLLGLIAGVRPLNRWFRSNMKRMKLATSGLSLTRKCLLLLNPLHPITALLSPTPTSATTLIGHLIELCSAFSDDIYCLFRLGIVGKRTGKIAEDWSNRLWLLTTLMGLYKLHLRTFPKLRQNEQNNSISYSTLEEPRRKPKELRDAEWTNRKLLADLVFVSFDVFEVSWFKEPIQCLAGLSAAFISTSKLYDQHWRSSLGKG